MTKREKKHVRNETEWIIKKEERKWERMKGNREIDR